MEPWEEKLKAEQGYYNSRQGGVAQSINDTDNCAQAVGRPKTAQGKTIDFLNERASQGKTQHDQSVRVLDILARHPEFLEFLEVMRSGLV